MRSLFLVGMMLLAAFGSQSAAASTMLARLLPGRGVDGVDLTSGLIPNPNDDESALQDRERFLEIYFHHSDLLLGINTLQGAIRQLPNSGPSFSDQDSLNYFSIYPPFFFANDRPLVASQLFLLAEHKKVSPGRATARKASIGNSRRARFANPLEFSVPVLVIDIVEPEPVWNTTGVIFTSHQAEMLSVATLTAVPEPSTGFLVGLGILGLAAIRRAPHRG